VSYAPIRRGRKTLRETLTDNLASERALFAGMDESDPKYAVAKARLDRLAEAIPPKRHRVVRPVDGKPPRASEHQEQVAVIQWWNAVHRQHGLPYFALFAIPNGGARDMITGANLKAEGVRRGALDLMLSVARGKYHGLFIEMKAGSNKPTDEQLEFIEHLNGAGYKACVHWSADAAIREIEAYMGHHDAS